jgi:metallophosphoesterase superfamily enzyme
VDHLAVTGDLGNVRWNRRWLAARRWIEGLAMAAAAVTVIPGNHDAYVPEVVEAQTFERLFADLPDGRAAPGPGVYPFAASATAWPWWR